MPVFALVAITVFRFNAFPHYSYLIQEDGPLENTQFLGYLGASLVLAGTALSLIRSSSKKQSKLLDKRVLATFCAVLALVLALVAMEEISWGQRVEHLQTPAYFAQHNIQDELSLHNLDTIQPYLEMGYVVLGILLCVTRPILQVVEMLTNRLIKHKRLLQESRKVIKSFLIFAPVWDLAGYFLPISAIYLVLNIFKPFGVILKSGVPLMVGRDQELGETLLALGLLIQAWRIWRVLTPQIVLGVRTLQIDILRVLSPKLRVWRV